MHPWWKLITCMSLLSIVVGLETGCVAVLSPAVRQSADRSITLTQLRQTPQAFLDRTVILGGDILHNSHTDAGTLLEILQKPLDSNDQPLLTDAGEGRFMVRCETFLDPAVYAAGRSVTVAGRVVGTRTDKVGESDYVYPLLSCLEIYLWTEPSTIVVSPGIWLWWEWDPWYADPWYWDHRPWYFRERYYHHHHHRHYNRRYYPPRRR